jgi:hypothetical protein
MAADVVMESTDTSAAHAATRPVAVLPDSSKVPHAATTSTTIDNTTKRMLKDFPMLLPIDASRTGYRGYITVSVCALFVLSCLVLSCLVLSCLVLSCLVLSCLVLSCLVLSCLVLSCLVFACFHIVVWHVLHHLSHDC